jgi:GT2 family glycosyltransferase
MQHLFIFSLLTKLKDSLLPNLQDIGYDWTWLIKDNASNDNTYDISSAWDKNIQPVRYKNNLQNFSQGMNYLFNLASPKDDDLILLLNNDVVFNDTTSLKNMIKIIKNKDVGVVGARLLFPNTNKLQHAGVIFDAPYRLPSHYRINEVSDADAEKNRIFQVVTGAVMLIRAGDYKNLSENQSGNLGMDEQFHWAFDDVALCLSVGFKMKKKIVYCGQTNISHEGSASLKKNPTNKLFMNHNVNCLLEKWSKYYALDKKLYDTQPNYNLYG